MNTATGILVVENIALVVILVVLWPRIQRGTKTLALLLAIQAINAIINSDKVQMVNNEPALLDGIHWFQWMILSFNIAVALLVTVKAWYEQPSDHNGSQSQRYPSAQQQQRLDDSEPPPRPTPPVAGHPAAGSDPAPAPSG